MSLPSNPLWVDNPKGITAFVLGYFKYPGMDSGLVPTESPIKHAVVLSSLGSFTCFQVHILNPDPRQAQALTGVEGCSDCSVEAVRGILGGSLGDRE